MPTVTQLNKVPYNELAILNDLMVDYLSLNDTLKPFISAFPDIEGFKAVYKAKASFSNEQRALLVQALQKDKNQYNDKQHVNLESLKVPQF